MYKRQVFTGELIKTNVLFENGIILGVDDYGDDEADEVILSLIHIWFGQIDCA